jgi:hypothetical protein
VFHRLAAVALFSGYVLVWPYAVISLKHIFVNEYFVVVESVGTDVHIVPCEEVLEWFLIVGVDEGVELIDHSRSTVVNRARHITDDFDLERSCYIAYVESSPKVDLVVERQAHPVVDTQSINVIFDLRNI